MFIPALISGIATVASTYLANKSSKKKAKTKQISNLSNEQEDIQSLIADAIKTGKGPLAGLFKGFDEGQFKEGVEKPALQNFTENILPQLQEKFIAGGQAGSPGAARLIGKAGQDLQSNLSNLRYQAQNSAQSGANSNMINLLNILQGKGAVESLHTPADPGYGPSILKAGSQITGDLASQGYKNYNATSAPQRTQAVVG